MPRIFAIGIALGLAAPVTAEVTNPNYVTYPDPALIQRDLAGLARVYRRNYDKFIPYRVPDGGQVLLVATDDVSDEQLLRAYGILDFYLTDVSGALYGADKTPVANAMAANDATLVMPGGADGNSPIRQRALQGQPLYALEFPTEGSPAYIDNDYSQRDAGFEEIFHMVHDTGIGTVYSDGPLKTTYQAAITKAMEHALQNQLWGRGDDTASWIDELRQEGSLEQEYIASVLDSYYGYWGPWTETPGGMWGIYAAKTRAEIETADPMGAALIPMFLPPVVTYMARIDPGFTGQFDMSLNADLPYTHKSQYLVKARLLGELPSGLHGNANDNVLIGNAGDNRIDGRDGQDVVQYALRSDQVQITRDGDSLRVTGEGIGTDQIFNVETLRFTDRDLPTAGL